MCFLASCWRLAAAILLPLAIAACTGGQDSASAGHLPAPRPLYERIGGQVAVTAIVDDFIVIATADPRIARRFKTIGNARFKTVLAEQLCVSAGGPCRYSGRAMKDAHTGMGISDAEFNAMTQDLRKAMARRDIAIDTQTEFVAALEPLRDDIVSPAVPTQSVVVIPPARPAPKKAAAAKKPASVNPR